MLIQFRIAYKTRLGQQLMLTGTLSVLGSGQPDQAVAMHYEENSEGIWTFLIRTDRPEAFEYRYFLREENQEAISEEWGAYRKFDPGKVNVKVVLLYDHWRSMADPGTALLSSAFTSAVFRPSSILWKVIAGNVFEHPGIELCFKPLISRINPGDKVLVSGNGTVGQLG